MNKMKLNLGDKNKKGKCNKANLGDVGNNKGGARKSNVGKDNDKEMDYQMQGPSTRTHINQSKVKDTKKRVIQDVYNFHEKPYQKRFISCVHLEGATVGLGFILSWK